MKSVVGKIPAVDIKSRMERGTGPMVTLVDLFARRGGAGDGMRSVWGVLAPLVIRICLKKSNPLLGLRPAVEVRCLGGPSRLGAGIASCGCQGLQSRL